jgi:hypothetical protein
MATPTKSILDQFLDQFERWMSQAEFGDLGELPLLYPKSLELQVGGK